MFLGIDHLAICAKDTTALAKWYCEFFGFSVMSNNGAAPPTIFVKGHTGSAIEIMPANDTPASPADFWDPGIRHFAISVDDFDAARERLAASGAELVGEERLPVGGGRLQSFRDPEGNIAQILWRP